MKATVTGAFQGLSKLNDNNQSLVLSKQIIVTIRIKEPFKWKKLN